MKNRHYKTKLQKEHAAEIDNLCKVLERYSKLSGTGLKFKPYQWTQRQTNNNAHPLAIIDGLTAVIKKWFDHKDPMRSAYTYANGVVKTKSGNYREADHVARSLKRKAEFQEALKNDRLKGLASGIGN